MGDTGADFTSLGVAVGHATDSDGATGLTIVRGMHQPLRGAVALFGRATGSRELHTLDPAHLADRVDALLLTGGSAYGLDACAGAMRWLEEHGRGFPVGSCVVPIVPAAVIFDLAPLGRFDARPTAEMAYAACDAARPAPIAEGSVGAGTGATVGKVAGAEWAMKGGVGCAVAASTGITVGALAVVNALGDVRDASGQILAGARGERGGFIDSARVLAGSAEGTPFARVALQNTTLCVVATDVPLSRVELTQVARAAGAALFRRITPSGTSYDGDIVFALCPREGTSASEGAMQVEALAVTALERAIERGVRLARGRDGIPGLADGGAP
jgi:L-aminopeptidase/D-esterase-like protein